MLLQILAERNFPVTEIIPVASEKSIGKEIMFKGKGYKVISAGPQYKRSAWHNLFWGKNYRKEWSTPVQLPAFYLDKEKGGLIPIKEGGGHQTTALHLETKDGKNYSIRSVDKRLGKVLPNNS